MGRSYGDYSRQGVGHPNYKGGATNRGSVAWFNQKIRAIRVTAKKHGHQPLLGIDSEGLATLYASHDRTCDICGKPESEKGKSLAVDHCHATGLFRGFLCSDCNFGLGKFKDDKIILQKALEYLN